ncbi:MAG TPA: phospho-N-acetylmuramoyl-pentapeptide-transferase [Clostridia bacterium]|nr:phospho-N-acetylmuramoyl-pentapeptide-transferase [Clostridia bacterium]
MINRLHLLSAIFLGVLFSLILGKVLIKKLHDLKYGQSIREEGPEAHYSKKGTPTMGGFIFLSSLLMILIINMNFSLRFILVITSTYGLGLVGFLDDYKIIKYKTNDGLSPKQKIIGQFLVSLAVTLLAYYNIGSDILIPLWNITIDLGYFYIIFNVFFILAVTNSVNLTDGLDGLSTSVTITVLTFFAFLAMSLMDQLVLIAIGGMIGSLLGFLFYNWNPAKVFMGDIGSLALGGFVAAIAIILKMQLFIPIIGFVYFMETLSVIIQVAYFKKTGKRVFKMTPIHHHFELSGSTEKEIVFKFSLITLIGGLIGMVMYFG